eukprot:jgi/Picre1/29225/NNA_004617.t1
MTAWKKNAGSVDAHQHIDTSHTCCLNESSPSSCLNVFRSWDARLDAIDVPLRSDDDDPELLLHIEFTGTVKLTGMAILNMGHQGSAPRRVRMFKNRNGLDFESVRDMKPDQEWDLFESHQAGTIEYPVKPYIFTGVHCLDVHIPLNFSSTSDDPDDCDEPTEITFIGLKGEVEKRSREAVHCVYESRPVPKDHQVPAMNSGVP